MYQTHTCCVVWLSVFNIRPYYCVYSHRLQPDHITRYLCIYDTILFWSYVIYYTVHYIVVRWIKKIYCTCMITSLNLVQVVPPLLQIYTYIYNSSVIMFFIFTLLFLLLNYIIVFTHEKIIKWQHMRVTVDINLLVGFTITFTKPT